jgi:acetylornithine/succinyldiaminopimelate/putrescine aminotransferase
LSVTPSEEFQASFPLLPDVITLPYGDAGALKNKVRELGPKNIAAIILEPLQGEAGVVAPPEDFLPAVEAIRQEHGILVIADEIQTGLGRTGHWFASVAGGLDPDIITLAKPLGGGVVPIGATIARKWIGRRLLGGVYFKRHSNTFGGGSLAMAVGLKSLELIASENLVARAAKLGERGRVVLKALQAKHPGYLQDARVAGMLLALQLQPLPPANPALEMALIKAYNLALQPVLAPSALPVPGTIMSQLAGGLAVSSLHKAGVHVCYSQNASRTVRLTPALNMPEELFDEMLARVASSVAGYHQSWQLIAKAPAKTVRDLVRLALLG